MKNIIRYCKILFRTQFALVITCVFAIEVVILYHVTYNLPELFTGAGRLFDLIYQLALGYIINFIFYIVNVFKPQIEKEERAFCNCKAYIDGLLCAIQRIETIFSSFIRLEKCTIHFETGTIYYKYPDSGGRSFICISEYLHGKASYLLQKRLKEITSNRYFNELDGRIVELVNEIQYGDFINYLNMISNCKEDLNTVLFPTSQYRNTLESSYDKFINTTYKLAEMCEITLSKPKKYITLKETELKDYLSYIEEQRKKCKTHIQGQSYYVDNNRIY